MAEHASPNDSCQNPCTCLCYNTSAFVHGQLLFDSTELCLRSDSCFPTYHEVVVQW
jgi:hypothetical protein